MIIYCSMMMKYTSLLLLSVLSVLFVPIIQNAHAQSNPLDQLIGGIKNLTSGAGKASNNTASQAGQSTQMQPVKQDNRLRMQPVKQDNQSQK